MQIQINDDKMTLAVTRVPQVYLYGTIDADAPNRFSALMKQWKIPTGSDIYLNSSDGDAQAGMALGRLIRSGAMVTHLGVPRRALRSSSTPAIKSSVCVGACMYAYMGGVYRWAPTGNDRIGLQAPKVLNASGDVAAYVKEMGIDASAATLIQKTPPDSTMWIDPDQLMADGIANNGRQPLTVTYVISAGAPLVTFVQTSREGEHRMTLLCRRDGMLLTSYDVVGADRARVLVGRSKHSYFELNGQESSTTPQQDATAIDQSVVLSRTYPLSQLPYLFSAHTLGAWLADRGGNFRYGFALQLEPVRNDLRKAYTDYYLRCQDLMQNGNGSRR